MDIALWIVQGLLAFVFLMAGSMKLMQPKEKMAEDERMGWVNDFSQTQLWLIGVAEVAGAAGLILPMLTDILPILTPIAATGLVLDMLGASYTHYRRNEFPMIGMTLVIGGLAAFVAVGRFFIETV